MKKVAKCKMCLATGNHVAVMVTGATKVSDSIIIVKGVNSLAIPESVVF